MTPRAPPARHDGPGGLDGRAEWSTSPHCRRRCVSARGRVEACQAATTGGGVKPPAVVASQLPTLTFAFPGHNCPGLIAPRPPVRGWRVVMRAALRLRAWGCWLLDCERPTFRRCSDERGVGVCLREPRWAVGPAAGRLRARASDLPAALIAPLARSTNTTTDGSPPRRVALRPRPRRPVAAAAWRGGGRRGLRG